MNLPKMAQKLQTALAQKKTFVSINHFQHFSEKAGRMVTKFVVNVSRDGNRETIYEGYKMAEVVVELAELLKKEGGGA